MKNKKLLKALLIAFFAVFAGVVFTFVKGSDTDVKEEITVESEAESFSEEEADPDGADEEEDPEEVICVHVCGAVNDPGVYYLEGGSRVYEAVEMAGGLLEDAAQEYVNLARELSDGEQIYIPTYEEASEQGLEIGSAGSSTDSSASDGLININTATSEELQTLPGIGQTKAEAIIAYREDNGDFSSIEDITNVSGIGESTYENIKDYITV